MSDKLMALHASDGDINVRMIDNGDATYSFAMIEPPLAASALAVAVAQAGNTDLITIDVSRIARLWVEIAVSGQDLDAFLVKGRTHASGSYQTLVGSVAANYTSPAGIIVGASGDLTTLAAATSGWIALDVRGLNSIKLQASSGNVAGSTVSAYAGGK
jgi:hypothetical protein